MKVIQKSGAWLWALLAALLLTVLLTATAFAGDNDFRCWTVDARQWTNQGCRSEQDGVWYLFLPQDESPADTVLSFSGSVTAASAGALDREGGTLTGAFAASDRVTLTLEGGRTETVCLRQSLSLIHISRWATPLPGSWRWRITTSPSWTTTPRPCTCLLYTSQP